MIRIGIRCPRTTVGGASRRALLLSLAACLVPGSFSVPGTRPAAAQEADAPEGVARAAGALRPKACSQDLPPDALCYDLPVFEDPAAGPPGAPTDAAEASATAANPATGADRIIDLNIAVLPATGPEPAPEPVFLLVGGPGQAATGAGVEGWMREGWEVVLVDQRGTGGSNPLACALHEEDESAGEWLGDWMPREAVRACRERLEERADLRRYTTPIAMDDLDAVREALGYERIDLSGGSYGTRAALVYLRRHPERVRAVLLHGAVRPDFHMPLTYPEDAQRALEGVLEDCEAEPACAEAFPDLREDYRRALARFDEGPVQVTVRDPASGGRVQTELPRGTWAQALRYLLYSAASAARVPMLLHRAAGGDYAPFADFILDYRRTLQGVLHDGMFFSVTCAEDVPFVDPVEAEQRAAGTFLGTWRWEQQKTACEEWPRGELPGGYGDVVRSDAPVLILSGELDPVTPPRRSEAALEGLEDGRHLTVPEAGHSWGGLTGGRCIARIRAEFLRLGAVEGLDVGCLETVGRGSFVVQPPEAAVALPVEALRRLEGRYAGPDLSLEVALEEGRLTAAGQGVPRLELTPVAPLRFRVEGAPPGTYLEFVETGEGEVRAVRVLQGGVEAAVLEREAP